MSALELVVLLHERPSDWGKIIKQHTSKQVTNFPQNISTRIEEAF